MEELQVIETTSGRQFKPWASREDVQAIEQAVEQAVQDPSSVTAVASEIASGKQAIASAINAKGGTASTTESFSELAQEIQSIQVQEITIDGGDMYAKQLYGVANNDITPGYWNLYEVLADLLSDARLSNYGGILLAEYHRGYDSLALSGAGAGGAYVVSDMENGLFKMYTNDTTHTWATEFDGKGNRWVAYCFADEYHDFDISDTDTSPRSIFIGRKVGTIKLLANARTSEIVVPDGNVLRAYLSNSKTSDWNKKITLRNIESVTGQLLYNVSLNDAFIDVVGDINTGEVTINGGSINSLMIKANSITLDGRSTKLVTCTGSFLYVYTMSFDDIGLYCSLTNRSFQSVTLQIEKFSGYFMNTKPYDTTFSGVVSLMYITNDKTEPVNITFDSVTVASTDFVLQDGWCKPLDISAFSALTKANVQAHIFDRLGVNDLSTGSVTITLANAVLSLFTQEEIDEVVERTNITIVGA